SACGAYPPSYPPKQSWIIVDAGGRVKTYQGKKHRFYRPFLELSVDGGGRRWTLRFRTLARTRSRFLPRGRAITRQVIARPASVPAPKFANPCGAPGFGFEVAMRAC